MDKKHTLYYVTDGSTNDVLETTAKKQSRSKANIASVVMREWASGQYGDKTSIKPEPPTQAQGQK